MTNDKPNHFVLCFAHKPIYTHLNKQYLSVLMHYKEKGPDTAIGWNLTGGHVKVGEPIQEAAYRELFEETGVDGDVTAWSILDRREFDNGIKLDTLIYELTADEIASVQTQTDKGEQIEFLTFRVQLGTFPHPMQERSGYAESIPMLVCLATQWLKNPNRRLSRN